MVLVLLDRITGKSHELEIYRNRTVGRGPECDIMIPDYSTLNASIESLEKIAKSISREFCKITKFSKRSLKEANSCCFRGCKICIGIYSNFSQENNLRLRL